MKDFQNFLIFCKGNYGDKLKDKVLIVDSDKAFVEELEKKLSKLNHFELIHVENGKKAIEIFSKTHISVFVTDIDVPEIESLELLAIISREYSGTPCIVMSSIGKPWFFENPNQNQTLYHLEKPVSISSITSAIMVGLYIRDEDGANRSFPLHRFLPLVELGRKTCRLEVEAPGEGRGYLYFNEGKLIDVHLRNLKPEVAIKEMLMWQTASLKFSDLPRRRSQKRLSAPLMELVSATWEKDRVFKSENFNKDWQLSVPILDDEEKKFVLSQVERFKKIKGYMAIAVLDNDFNLILGDEIEKDMNLSGFLREMGSSFADIFNSNREKGLAPCKILSLETAKAIIHILHVVEHDFLRFYLIGVTSCEGNWLFMKFELENLAKQLRKGTKRTVSRDENKIETKSDNTEN